MTRIRKLVLLNLGFLWVLNNVFSDVLDLKDLENSGFPLTISEEEDYKFTEITPVGHKGITKVVNGSQALWACDGTWMCVRVVLINCPSLADPIMHMKCTTIDDGEQLTYYFSKNGDFYQVEEDEFLAHFFQAEESSPDDDTSTQDSSSHPLEDEEDDEEYPNQSVLTQGGDNLPKRKQKRSATDSSSSQGGILDIKNPANNTGVKFEYDMLDGVPSLTVTPKKSTKVTTVCEGSNHIWAAEKDQSLVLLSGYALYGEYRLVEVFYSEDGQNYNIFYLKGESEWQEVEEEDYISSYSHLKSKIVHIADITLDLSNVNNADKFLCHEESNGVYNASVYLPLTGFHLTRVVDGERHIWSSDCERCVAATPVKRDGRIEFLKLEFLKEVNKPEYFFFKFADNGYEKISEEEFERSINPDQPVPFGGPLSSQ